MSQQAQPNISRCIANALEQYFRDLGGEKPAGIYDMVIKSAERPMLEIVLKQANGNQTRAAEMLGLNRNTLRKKLTEYQLL
jgi:Fis family transcriptional regulator